MKKLLIYFVFILFGIIFGSCATIVVLKIKKPADFPVPAARSIGILDVVFVDEMPLIDISIDKKFRDAVEYHFIEANEKYKTDDKITVMAYEKLIEAMSIGQYFDIHKSEEIFQGISWYESLSKSFQGLAERKSISAFLIPRIIRVEHDCRINYDYHISGYNWEGTPTWVRKISIDFEYIIIDLNGNVLASQKYNSNEMSTGAAASSVLSEIDLAENCIVKIFTQMVTQLLPKTTKGYYNLAADKTNDPQMKEAQNLVKLKQYTQAKDHYIQIFNDTRNPAAAINAGIMFRALDNLKNGLEWLKKANESLNDKAIAKEIGIMEADLEQLNLIYE